MKKSPRFCCQGRRGLESIYWQTPDELTLESLALSSAYSASMVSNGVKNADFGISIDLSLLIALKTGDETVLAFLGSCYGQMLGSLPLLPLIEIASLFQLAS